MTVLVLVLAAVLLAKVVPESALVVPERKDSKVEWGFPASRSRDVRAVPTSPRCPVTTKTGAGLIRTVR